MYFYSILSMRSLKLYPAARAEKANQVLNATLKTFSLQVKVTASERQQKAVVEILK